MCKYCNAINVNTKIHDADIDVLILEKELEVTYYDPDNGWKSKEIKINYCPMCGRKFEV